MTRQQARQEINETPNKYLQAAKKSGYVCPCCGSGSGTKGTGITLDPNDKQKTHFKCHKCGEYGDTLHFLMVSGSKTETAIFNESGIVIDNAVHCTHTQPTYAPPAAAKETVARATSTADGPQCITLYRSNARGKYNDPEYPYRVDIKDIATFTEAMMYDHVAAEYKDNHRSNKNFISSNCLMFDCDNADSEDPSEWTTQEKIKSDFAGVPLFICCSKNHMKEKSGGAGRPPKAARPRFHVYIPLETVDNAETYKALQDQVLKCFPYFDKAAATPAHFFQGVENPQVEYIAGSKNILQHLKDNEPERLDYINSFASSYASAFMGGIKESASTPVISTGFRNLDDLLDGGLYPGLYTLGAVTSVGKTSFMVQVCDQIAKTGQHVMYYSLEMSSYEIMAKSISRLTYSLCETDKDAKTTRGILAGHRYKTYNIDEEKLIKNAVKEYFTGSACNIKIIEGVGNIGINDIRQQVERHIQYTGKTPLVVIDYLQIIAPADPRMLDKQNTDRNILELKRMSRDLKLPVVCISSFNRGAYKGGVSLEAFKESGAIEYGSDVLLGLQGVKGASETREPYPVEVKILKQRNGPKDQSAYFNYYMKFNTFEESNNSSGCKGV